MSDKLPSYTVRGICRITVAAFNQLNLFVTQRLHFLAR